MENGNDRFVTYVAENRILFSYAIVAVLMLIGILFLFIETISPQYGNYATIYGPYFILTFAGIFAAYVTKGRNFLNTVVYGVATDYKKYLITAGIGLLGAVIIDISLFSVASSVIPYLAVIPGLASVVSFGATLTTAYLAYIFVVVIISPFQEELLFASFLLPTFANSAVESKGSVLGAIVVVGFAIFFLYVQQPLILLALIGVGLLFLSPQFRRYISKRTPAHLYGMALVACLFPLFHLGVYGTVSALAFLFIFRIIMDAINWWRQSTVSSIIMHSANNNFTTISLISGGILGNLPLSLGLLAIPIILLGLPFIDRRNYGNGS